MAVQTGIPRSKAPRGDPDVDSRSECAVVARGRETDGCCGSDPRWYGGRCRSSERLATGLVRVAARYVHTPCRTGAGTSGRSWGGASGRLPFLLSRSHRGGAVVARHRDGFRAGGHGRSRFQGLFSLRLRRSRFRLTGTRGTLRRRGLFTTVGSRARGHRGLGARSRLERLGFAAPGAQGSTWTACGEGGPVHRLGGWRCTVDPTTRSRVSSTGRMPSSRAGTPCFAGGR